MPRHGLDHKGCQEHNLRKMKHELQFPKDCKSPAWGCRLHGESLSSLQVALVLVDLPRGDLPLQDQHCVDEYGNECRDSRWALGEKHRYIRKGSQDQKLESDQPPPETSLGIRRMRMPRHSRRANPEEQKVQNKHRSGYEYMTEKLNAGHIGLAKRLAKQI